MAEVYLGLGSNIGDREFYLSEAIRNIQLKLAPVKKLSSVYETEPWGNKNQGKFLNQVVLLNTTQTPDEVLSATKEIELDLGRERKERWGERTIDIDFLFYNNLIINKEGLILPHPGIADRMFVLQPLLEINPALIHPEFNRTIKELHQSCADTLDVILIKS